MTESPLLDRALIEEAVRKSGLLWVRAASATGDRAVWHVWHDGAVCLVVDGAEQPGTGLAAGADVTVIARSKDSGGRLVAFPARVEELAAGTDAWQATAEELRGKRLNAPDYEAVLDRWARESRLLRLVPDGPSSERPGALPDGSLAAAPVPSPALTRDPVPAPLPRLLFRRRKNRKGSV